MNIIIAIAIFYGLFLILIFLGMFIPALTTIIKLRTYKPIQVTIIEDDPIETIPENGIYKVTKYKYEYEYKGKKYYASGFKTNRYANLKAGDVTILYINEDNPSQYLKPQNVDSRYLFLFLSIFLMIIFSVFYLTLMV